MIYILAFLFILLDLSLYKIYKLYLTDPLTNNQWKKRNKFIKINKILVLFVILLLVFIFNNIYGNG